MLVRSTYKQIISAILLLSLCTQVFASGMSVCLMKMDGSMDMTGSQAMTGHEGHAQAVSNKATDEKSMSHVAMMSHDTCADDCDCTLFGCLAPSLTSNNQAAVDAIFEQNFPNNFRLTAIVNRTDLLFRPPI